MRKKIVEGSVLFISIVKWLFIASCIGIIVGISTTVFLNVLGLGIAAAVRDIGNVAFRARKKTISASISALVRRLTRGQVD